MKFNCKDCKTEFEIDDKEFKRYYNYFCPECGHIAPLKDSQSGSYIFKCSIETAHRNKS